MSYQTLPGDEAIARPDPRDPRSKDLPTFRIGPRWLRWLSGLTLELNKTPSRQASVKLTGQGAAIATTALPIGSVTPGIWSITTSLRVTRVGSVSSSVRLTIAWTEGGVSQTEQGTLLNGNLTTTREGRVFVVRPDNATTISYSTTYADGGGAVPMQYSLDLVAVRVAQDE